MGCSFHLLLDPVFPSTKELRECAIEPLDECSNLVLDKKKREEEGDGEREFAMITSSALIHLYIHVCVCGCMYVCLHV